MNRGAHYSYHHVSYHRVAYRAHGATSARHHAVATVERASGNEKPTLAKSAIAGGLMSGIASVYSGGRTANGEVAAARARTGHARGPQPQLTIGLQPDFS
jgi:hypothetical protein